MNMIERPLHVLVSLTLVLLRVVAGLIIVRYILAAIEAPHEFGLMDSVPDPSLTR